MMAEVTCSIALAARFRPSYASSRLQQESRRQVPQLQKSGTVLLLAGENPDDIRARFLVLADAYGFKAEDLKMRFVAGVIDIVARMSEIKAEAEKIGDLVLVIVDTAAAYFPGNESNSNSQQGPMPGRCGN